MAKFAFFFIIILKIIKLDALIIRIVGPDLLLPNNYLFHPHIGLIRNTKIINHIMQNLLLLIFCNISQQLLTHH